MPYSPREYAEMYYYYGAAQGNAREAARMYQEQLIRRGGIQPQTYPDYRVFLRARNAYMEGRIPGTSRPEGVPRIGPDQIEEVLEEAQRDSATSTRAISRRTGLSHMSVHRILQAEGMHPYHVKKVQDLLPVDYPRRVAFCQDMINRCQADEDFFDNIMWTDESTFSRNGIFNMHNYHSWSFENPHAVRRHSFQHQFSVNLWTGVFNRQLIGPFELPTRVNGEAYLSFLQNNLPEMLEDVNLAVRRQMYFQCDGAPCHFARNVKEYLNEIFPRRWIGRGGPIAWPPRSPDLNPVDFFIWGYYKELVYKSEYSSIEQLRQKLNQAQMKIREKEDSFRRLKRNFIKRCRLCIANNGAQFEHLL